MVDKTEPYLHIVGRSFVKSECPYGDLLIEHRSLRTELARKMSYSN